MVTRPEIAAALGNFVLVDLYADGTDPESEANQQLEQSKFSTIAIPYYAILDPDEKVIATFDGQTRDAARFLAFLDQRAPGGTASATAAAAGPLAGTPITTLGGAAFNSADFSGKVLVVNFWATWCIPCIQEIPSFNKVHRELKDKGVAVVGISMDEEDAPAKVKAF